STGRIRPLNAFSLYLGLVRTADRSSLQNTCSRYALSSSIWNFLFTFFLYYCTAYSTQPQCEDINISSPESTDFVISNRYVPVLSPAPFSCLLFSASAP